MKSSRVFAAVVVVGGSLSVAQAEMVTLEPVRDNTLYESSRGTLSNGAGSHFFAGKNNDGQVRRALLAFDIAGGLPEQAAIERATLILNMSRTGAGLQAVALHRVLADWGEGASDAVEEEGGGALAMEGDATWIHTFFDTEFWDNSGGDFAAAASASQQVGSTGPYVWGSTPQMVADVQDWLERPGENFGWILIGNEGPSRTTKRFDSRERLNEEARPMLVVEFGIAAPTLVPTATPTPTTTAASTPTPTSPPSCVGDCDGSGKVSIGELVTSVNIALDLSPLSRCPGLDDDNDNRVAISELVAAVNNALFGCSRQ